MGIWNRWHTTLGGTMPEEKLPELSEDEKNFEPLDVEDDPSEADLARANRVLPPPDEEHAA